MNKIIISAIIIALNEQGFIEPCLRAIYPFVTRIYVISNYDTDWYGHKLEPDRMVETVIHFDDPEKKITLLLNRKILDETIHRNWAMSTDQGLYKASHFRFRPHAYSLSDIRRQSPQTDFFWIIDADEIYDPETIPGAIDFVSRTKADAVMVRGHNFFKSWNHRISLASDHFWQIGFLRPGRYFHCHRMLYAPRFLTLVWRTNRNLYWRLRHLYWRDTLLPEDIAHFYHGSYVGDDSRMCKKIQGSDAAAWFVNVDEWFEKVWRNPERKKFRHLVDPEGWVDLEYVPTAELPTIIRDSPWPEGWIERLGQHSELHDRSF